jgi:hypothetical protein
MPTNLPERPVGRYVVSYKRAGAVRTDLVVKDCKIVVPESQLEEYQQKQELRNGATIVACPDSADGNVARKRNWVLDNAEEDDVLLLDDDYSFVGCIESGVSRPMEMHEVERLIHTGFELMHDAGTAKWGINQQSDPKFYREYSFISLTSPVLGPWQGFSRKMLGNIRYDESLDRKEDYDMSLQVARRYHRLVRLNKYHYMVDHFGIAGGVVTQRTLAEEERQLKRLRAKWGHHVVSWDLSRSVNPRVRIPIPGI